MFVQQKPGTPRVLNLSPLRIYVFVNEQNERWLPQMEAAVREVNNDRQRLVKCQLVDFYASQSTLAGAAIDIHLYNLCTVVQLIARLFPTSSEDFTFLPDSVEGLPDEADYPARLTAKLTSLCAFLERQMLQRLQTATGSQLSQLPEPGDERFAQLQERLGLPTPEESDAVMRRFLNYSFNASATPGESVFVNMQGHDFSQLRPRFRCVIRDVPSAECTPSKRDIRGELDIVIVPDAGEPYPLNFQRRDAKMIMLLTLLTQKYGFGLAQRLFELDNRFVFDLWGYLYPADDFYSEDGDEYDFATRMQDNGRFRQARSLAVAPSRNPEMTALQEYWLTLVDTEVSISNLLSLTAYSTRLDPNAISVEAKFLDNAISQIPPKEAYRPGYAFRQRMEAEQAALRRRRQLLEETRKEFSGE